MALILVIDDEPEMRRLLRRILVGAGHRVIEAENGASGLRHLERERPDLVITDILMPDKDGIETIQEIRSAQAGMRIIAMTGGGRYQGFEYLDIAKALGADALLSKPFRSAELLDAVAQLVSADPQQAIG